MMNPRTKKLGRIDDVDIWLVDGEKIRNRVDIDFVAGGHGYVYPRYIPKNEVWLDQQMPPLDATATLFHEIYERDLMAHRRMTYDEAHDRACVVEADYRQRLERRPPRSIDLQGVEREFVRTFKAN